MTESEVSPDAAGEQKAVDSTARTTMDVARAMTEQSAGLETLLDVGLTVTAELGRTRMKIREILNLGSGSILELSKLASEPVELLVNDTPFAEGEVVVVEDSFAVRITRLLDRAKALGDLG